jgi:integrase
MVSRPRYIRQRLRKYLTHRTRRRKLSKDNAKRYEKHLYRFSMLLADAGLCYTPAKIGEREVDYLLSSWEADRVDTDTQQWYCCMLNGYLKFYKNNTVKDMDIGWPAETRTNVDWLTPEEAIALYKAADNSSSPAEKMIIHLELRLWLRRVEVRRLTPKDIMDGVMSVHGKGKVGGKWRHRAFAPETMPIVMEYEQRREEMLERARYFHETSWRTGKRAKPRTEFEEPESWIIYQRGKRVSGYSNSGIDDIVARVAKRAGIQRKIGNHTLRRTGARLAWLAKVDIDVIKEGLGHKDREETYRYLGITVDEQAKSEELVSKFLQEVEEGMDGQSEKTTPQIRAVRINSGAPK